VHPSFLPGPGVPGLVSVIIPTFNRADIIRETLDSVLAQTYSNFEAIVIDDGSADRTRAVVSAYRDPRIKYSYKENGGLSSARNAGLDLARGEFIAFLDSDDVWHSWKLAAQVEMFRRHPEVGMIWTDMSAFTNDGQVTAERYLRTYYTAYSRVDTARLFTHAGTLGELAVGAPAELATCNYYIANIFREMFNGNLVHPPTAIVRRDRLRDAGSFQHDVTRGGAEDYHFYLRITQRGPVALLDAPAMLYRVHSGSMSKAQSLREAHGDLRVLLHWRDVIETLHSKSAARARLAGAHAWVGSEELYGGNPRAATAHLWLSLCLKPSRPMVAWLLMVSLLPSAAVTRGRAVKQSIRRMTRPALLLRLGLSLTGGLFVAYRLMLALQLEYA